MLLNSLQEKEFTSQKIHPLNKSYFNLFIFQDKLSMILCFTPCTRFFQNHIFFYYSFTLVNSKEFC